MVRIYVASSWRNDRQPDVVSELLGEGYEVYNFRQPEPGDDGFHWSDIDPAWKSWTPEKFRKGLDHPIAELGYSKDFAAMCWADVCVLVMPCGRSAHIEAGWFVGHPDKTLVILLDTTIGESELMYKMADHICVDMGEVKEALSCQPL